MSANEIRLLSYYRHQTPITTRWSDNDQYGHLNNSIYYMLFDALVNQYLILQCGLNTSSTSGEDRPGAGPIGLVIASGCRYHGPVTFPSPLIGGLTIFKLGSSSVTYHVAIFEEGQMEAAASGWFTHVFVDPKSRRPTAMTKKCRTAFLRIATDQVIQDERQRQVKSQL